MDSTGTTAALSRQRKFELRGVEYPQRPAFFALRYQKMLLKTCAAQDVGFDGLALLMLVVIVEDNRRYASPPGFFNSQLESHLGMTYKQLRLTRQKCIDRGWLHYEAGGRRRQGLYWVVVPECFRDVLHTDEQQFISLEGKQKVNQLGNQLGNQSGNPPVLDPIPIPTTSKEPAVVVVDENSEDMRRVETRLLEIGLGKAVETVREALPNGLTLAQMTSVIEYYASRPDAWGPGALRKRLLSPSAPHLASDQGWPPPSPKEKRRIEEAAAVAEQRQHSSARASSNADRERTRQLELQFGQQLDALTVPQMQELLQRPWERKLLVHLGAHAPTVRPSLLKAFAERYGSVEAG